MVRDELLFQRAPVLQMNIFESIVVFTGCWALLLAVLWLLPCLSLEFKQQGADRCLGFVHAVAVSICGLMIFFSTSPSCSIGLAQTLVNITVYMLIGFLAVDFASMSVCDIWKGWRPVDFPMLFHHVLIFTLLVLICVLDIGVWFGATLSVNECSTPFLHIFWHLQRTGQKDSTAFLVNGLMLLLVFFLCRIVFIPVSFYEVTKINFCQHGRPLWMFWAIVLSYAIIYALNLFWFGKLARGAWKTLQGNKNMTSDSEELDLGQNDALASAK